jgi:hypothetical protein
MRRRLRPHKGGSWYNCLSRRVGGGEPLDSAMPVWGVAEACDGTRVLAVVCKAGGWGNTQQE